MVSMSHLHCEYAAADSQVLEAEAHLIVALRTHGRDSLEAQAAADDCAEAFDLRAQLRRQVDSEARARLNGAG